MMSRMSVLRGMWNSLLITSQSSWEDSLLPHLHLFLYATPLRQLLSGAVALEQTPRMALRSIKYSATLGFPRHTHFDPPAHHTNMMILAQTIHEAMGLA